MTQAQFHHLLDELLELDPGTIRGTEVLADLSRWDSLALIGFIALLDQHFGRSVLASRIIDCKTVADLRTLVADQLTD